VASAAACGTPAETAGETPTLLTNRAFRPLFHCFARSCSGGFRPIDCRVARGGVPAVPGPTVPPFRCFTVSLFHCFTVSSVLMQPCADQPDPPVEVRRAPTGIGSLGTLPKNDAPAGRVAAGALVRLDFSTI